MELALTGSGLPVLLQFDPGRILNFAPCFMGGHSEIHCVMQNRSKSLPLMYHFKKIAHFKIDPQKGKIDEGCMQVRLSFYVSYALNSLRLTKKPGRLLNLHLLYQCLEI